MHYDLPVSGTCSRRVSFDIEDGKVFGVRFEGGCNGNLKGIASLTEGMDAKDVVARLKGIRCGFKPTSCPDQLARAVEHALTAV